MELKLTNVAKASLAELRLDYEDFLRQHRLALWQPADPRRQDLINQRCTTADEVAAWVKATAQPYTSTPKTEASSTPSTPSNQSLRSKVYPEVSANAALVLIAVATGLLDRQVAAQAEAFDAQGGFTERLYHRRRGTRNKGGGN